MKRDNRAFFLGQVRLLVGYKSGRDLSATGALTLAIFAIAVSTVAFLLLK